MSEEICEESIQQMIALGDVDNRGYVDLDGFMKLMHQIGLIKKE